MNTNNLKIEDYKKTDPDNFQFGIELMGGTFHFKEFDRTDVAKFQELKELPYTEASEFIKKEFNNSDIWVEETIRLSAYNEQEIENAISAYYEDLAEIKEIYGDDWMFIVAECIFEQNNGLY